MKFATSLAVLVTMAASATAHMALLYPVPRGGYNTPEYNGRIQTWIGYKDSVWTQKYPCGGYKPNTNKKFISNFKAGQTVNVRFAASTETKSQLDKQPKVTNGKQFEQARHGGGTCEFSLSYDGGKTFGLIGRYTKTCPDAYYEWPVKIPKNAASCMSSKKYGGKSSQCLFVWSWTANILPQFYQNCADINLAGSGNKKPKTAIQVVDFKGHKTNVHAVGDGVKHTHGPGPQKSEISYNMNHKFM